MLPLDLEAMAKALGLPAPPLPDAQPAVPALRHALSDGDPRVRSSSVTALGAIVPPDSEAVLDIRHALVDKSADVRFSVRAALRRLGRS